ncbi:oligosaccharide flippase family protein [Photobacterium damselae]|uniref:oligosaccharide flippase family protein n=1 Tax=Photobacterium damselae TaxID=38293 RepID=UPI00254377C2
MASTKTKNIIIKNFSYLSLIQFITLISPFIYYPYLIRIYGPDKYGFIIYCQSIVLFLSVFVDFGINLYGPKVISENREDVNKLSEIVSSLFMIKIIMMFLMFIFYVAIILIIPELRTKKEISLLLFFVILNDVFYAIWFFQGIEKNKYSALINLLSRAFLLVFIFLGVNTRLGFYAFPLGLVLASIINSILSVYFIFFVFKVKFRLVKFNLILIHFKQAYLLFISRFVGLIIIRLNGFLIGTLWGVQYVAYYDLAEKIVNLLSMPLNILNQVIYPRVAISKNYSIVFSIIKYTTSSYFLIYGLLLIFGKDLVIAFAGNDMLFSYKIILILAITLIINSMSYFLGNCILVVSGNVSYFNKSIYYSTAIYILLLLLFYLLDILNPLSLSFLIVINCLSIVVIRVFYILKLKRQILSV